MRAWATSVQGRRQRRRSRSTTASDRRCRFNHFRPAVQRSNPPIPSNLYARGEQPAAFKAAQNVETKFGQDPKRLLESCWFLPEVERGTEVDASRKRGEACARLAEAHRILALGLHISLRLDEAAANTNGQSNSIRLRKSRAAVSPICTVPRAKPNRHSRSTTNSSQPIQKIAPLAPEK